LQVKGAYVLADADNPGLSLLLLGSTLHPNIDNVNICA